MKQLSCEVWKIKGAQEVLRILEEEILSIDHPYTTEDARHQFNHVKDEAYKLIQELKNKYKL